nr:hypothetical protein [Tanacetum cinerariifolium]
RHVVSTTVLTKSNLVPLTAARPITTAVLQPYVTRPRPAKTIVTKPHSPPRRTINRRSSPAASNFPPQVTTVKAPKIQVSYGLGPKETLTFLLLVHGNPQHALKDKEFIDRGCSRHMIRNMSYLTDFEEINGGYFAFGGNPKGGKISSKGKIRTGSGLTWLFDIDTLIKSMTNQPVTTGNQCNPSEDVQEQFDAEKVGEENLQQYVLFPLWSFGSKDPSNTDVPTVGQISTNSTNTFSAGGPSNTAVSLTLGESSYVDPSQYPDEPNMLALEDITYSDDKEDEKGIDYEEVFAPVVRIEAI